MKVSSKFIQFVIIKTLQVQTHTLRSATFTPDSNKCSSSLEDSIFFSFFSFFDIIFFTFASWQKEKTMTKKEIWF